MMILPPERSDKPTAQSRITWTSAAYYSYDAAGRMEHAKSGITDLGTAYYEFDANSRFTKKTLGNNCYAYYEYDNANRSSWASIHNY